MQEEYIASSHEGATFTDPSRCPQCGKPLIGLKSTQKFCNRQCWNQYWREHVKTKLHTRRDQYWAEKHGTRTADDYDREQVSDGELWLARSRFWLEERDCFSLKSKPKHQPDSKPLILTGHGVQLKTECGALVVRDGFTHYPQTRREWRFYPSRKSLPSRIVLLDVDGYISLSVMQWLCEQRIPLVALNWQGEVVTCIGGDSLSADFGLRQLQLAAQSNGVGLKLAIQLIQLKIAASKSTLDIFPDSKLKKRALEKIDRCLEELAGPVPDVEALRMIEARAAVSYFDVWQSLPMRWKGTGRHPIPMDWLMVGGRQSLVSGTNRNATHPANALLNYAYGVLESQIRIAATSAGFDPAVGYLHASRPGRVALVYDFMEPLRPLVDKVILELLRMNTFTPSDFILNAKGVCRLNPEMARRITALAVSETKVQSVIKWTREEIVSLSDQEPDG